MKIQPVSSPHAIPTVQSNDASAKARAVAAFNKASQAPTQGQAQETPVADPNRVTAEELGAIQTSSQETTETSDNLSQEEATTETQVAESKPEKDPALERQFAQLARQERILRSKAQQQDQALRAREAALEAREQALSQAPKFDANEYIPRARLIQDALGVLEAEGIATYDDLTQRAMSRQPVDPQLQATIDQLKNQIAELKTAAETNQKSHTEQQQQAYQAAIKQISADAKKLVTANPVEYEAISKTGSVKDVVELVEQHYQKYGEVLTVEEAAQEVENYLVEEGLKISTSIDKIKRRLNQNVQSEGDKQKTQGQGQQTQPKMKTLTNAASSTRKLSARERAVLAFKGELKS